jgi:hypothetical protein
VNARGYRVELRTAQLALGPLYLYSAKPQASLLERVGLIGTAFACPAHAQMDRGLLIGEVLTQQAVDLLSNNPIPLGPAQGEAGEALSFEVHLHPAGAVPAGPGARAGLAALEGRTVLLEGTATRDGEAIPFRAHLDIPDTALWRIVTNIPTALSVDSPVHAGRASLRILVDRWFERVEFSELPMHADGSREFEPGSAAFSALVMFGMRSREAYSMEWEQ